MSSNGVRLLIYGISMYVSIYIFSCLIARKLRKIHLSRVLLYMASLAMIGALSEIFCDTIYVHLFHYRLWYYQFLPVHHAYTSQYSPVIWSAMGFWIYLLHHKYEKWTQRELVILSVIFSLETIVIEGLSNGFSKLFLGKILFYYNPGNLWHVTSLQSIPFFFLVGILTLQTIHWFKSSPHYFTFISSWVTGITIFFR